MDAFKTDFLKGSIGCLLILFVTDLYAQNLIPNPGFDNLSQCPHSWSQIELATPWVSANNGTPDVWNECSIDPDIRVPYAGRYFDSYQLQRSGTGYAGIYIYSSANWIGNECIETPLSTPLVKGKNYYVEFYVSPDLSPLTHWIYTDAIALAFSDTFVYKELTPHESMGLIPAIEHPPVLITDTVSWTRTSGCYMAQGGEQYAIIGNLKSTSETRVEVEDPGVWPYAVYYYVEDVLVTLYDPLPDTSLICNGEIIKLTATFMDASYAWNTGETDSVIMINTPGIYSVQTTINGCSMRDTIVVLSLLDPPYFPSDTLLCDDELLTLNCPIPGTYQWSDGSTQKSNRITQSGVYSVSVTNTCGEFEFETNVQFESCDCTIYVPNILSLNQDGINDQLRIGVNCDFEYRITEFYIYDRWGNEVLRTSDLPAKEIVWDGRSRGNLVSSGVYTWGMKYSTYRNTAAETFVRTGDITVIR